MVRGTKGKEKEILEYLNIVVSVERVRERNKLCVATSVKFLTNEKLERNRRKIFMRRQLST